MVNLPFLNLVKKKKFEKLKNPLGVVLLSCRENTMRHGNKIESHVIDDRIFDSC